MMIKNKFVIIITVILLIVGGVLIWYVVTKPKEVVTPVISNSPDTTAEITPPTSTPTVGNSPIKINEYPNRTNDELNSTIIKAAPQPLVRSNGKANYIILTVVSPIKAWYIVTIRLTTVQTDDAKIIIKDNGTAAGGLEVIAGPGTTFPDAIDLPPEVRIALS